MDVATASFGLFFFSIHVVLPRPSASTNLGGFTPTCALGSRPTDLSPDCGLPTWLQPLLATVWDRSCLPEDPAELTLLCVPRGIGLTVDPDAALWPGSSLAWYNPWEVLPTQNLIESMPVHNPEAGLQTLGTVLWPGLSLIQLRSGASLVHPVTCLVMQHEHSQGHGGIQSFLHTWRQAHSLQTQLQTRSGPPLSQHQPYYQRPGGSLVLLGNRQDLQPPKLLVAGPHYGPSFKCTQLQYQRQFHHPGIWKIFSWQSQCVETERGVYSFKCSRKEIPIQGYIDNEKSGKHDTIKGN